MAGEVSRVDDFIKYLNEFLANIRPDDPLPVRAPSYKVTENEIDGQILDIVHHYLNGKDCPVFVRSYVAHKVWEHMRQPAIQSCDGGSDGRDSGEDDDDSDDDGDGSAPANSTYEAMKLIRDVTSKANDVIRDMCRTFTPEKVAKTPHYLPVSSFAIKNSRRKMEDRHIILRDLNTLYDMDYGYPHAFYGVFDGHAGADAAMYTAAHLHQYLIQNPLYHMDPDAALKHAFHFADTNFLKKAKKERLKGGTTAVVALLREKRLAVAWLGDSLAVLVRRRKPIKLVEPHNPGRQSERDRVTNLGGVVVKLEGSWRILGQLAVSRAIGDADYKPFVSSECDIKSLEIVGDEDFLILATDGLWDTITYDEAVSFVYAYLTINQGDCEGVGRCLVEQARRQGSHDNITAVVVFLRPVDVLMEEEAARRQAGEIPESEMDPSWVMKKDAAPSTIYEIFSTFNPDSPSNTGGDYNPFSPNTSGMAAPQLENGGATTEETTQKTHMASYGQAPGEEFDLSVGLPVSNTPDPTMEDVESALAELDSLPDGETSTDRDENTEPWNMDSIRAQQKEDFVEQDHFHQQMHIPEDPSPYHQQDVEVVPDTIAPDLRADISNGVHVDSTPDANDGVSHRLSSSPPSSPRSVEGFVTSVELNTAQEQLIAGGFDAGAPVEQQSGPFSVYVSSSPEPASLDALVDTAAETLAATADDEVSAEVTQASPVVVDTECDSKAVQEVVQKQEESVEIVHAQSMVEVVAPPSPTHEPELQFVAHPVDVEPVPTPSPVYTPAPLNDLMSTSMILEEPISDAPAQMEHMMQFMATNPEVVYNQLELQQTAEIVHIESERHGTPEIESGNLLDDDDSYPVSSPPVRHQSPVGSGLPDVVSPVQAEVAGRVDIASPRQTDITVIPVQSDVVMSPVQANIIMIPMQADIAMSPVQAGIISPVREGVISPVQARVISPVQAEVMSPVQAEVISPVQSDHISESGAEQQMSDVPAPQSPIMSPQNVEDALLDQMNRVSIDDGFTPVADIIAASIDPVCEHYVQDDLVAQESESVVEHKSPEPAIREVAASIHTTPEPVAEQSVSPAARALSPIEMARTPISDVTPSTPMKEPMINDRPVSPIHTPKADMVAHDAEILSEIAAPALNKQAAADKKAPVKPAPRTIASRSRPQTTTTTTTTAPKTTTPTTLKPGTPRPSARTTPGTRPTPGGAVRNTAAPVATKAPASKATPTTRTPLSSRTTPGSRSTSATSTSTTRTTTTARTPLSSRTTTPSATRTTPSSSATRTTPSTVGASRPTPTSRTTRPTTTPSSLKATTTSATSRITPSSATRPAPSSRPTSATTTPTTARRVPISRRAPTAAPAPTPAPAPAAPATAAKDATDAKPSTPTTTRAPAARKPLYPGPKTTTATKPTAASDKKDIKNTTNKLLSSRTSTLTTRTTTSTTSRTTTTAPTHKPLASRTTATTKRVGTLTTRTTATNKTAVKATTDKPQVIGETTQQPKKEVTTPETNGEVKIAQEETCVEVVTKEDNELHEINGSAELSSEILLNGD